jgi:hypothetical protein
MLIEKRRKRADAGARILEIQKHIKPDPEGWTLATTSLMAAVVLQDTILPHATPSAP